jgi:peptidylprolyl isomerase
MHMSLLSRRYALAAATAIALAACGDKAKVETPTPPPADAPQVAPAPAPGVAADPATTTFAPALGVDLAKSTHTATGLYYRDIVVGKGERADSGMMISVHYTGYLADGTMFETSTTASPIEFPVGTGRVVTGWDQGIPGMKVGGKRQLIIPAALGYGAAGSPPKIPGGAIMIFTVELMAVNK